MPRGRPKGSKNKASSFNLDNSKTIVENPVAKKRGRPRKSDSSTPSVKEVILVDNSSENSETIKRGRGRPRKNPVENSLEMQTSGEKRGRGRPKKVQELDNNTKKDVNEISLKRTYNYNVVTITDYSDVEISSSSDKTRFELLIQNELDRIKKVNFKVNSTSNSVSKPNVEIFDDAVEIKNTENGREIFLHCKIGDVIFIQYPQNWRKTEKWIIQSINHETGDVGLTHFEENYYACTNYIYGPTIYGLKIKKLE